MGKNLNSYNMVITAIMTALVYTATIIVRIPTPGGMVHLGDFMIFVSVLMLGTKKAVFASGVGMFLVNVLGGFIHWAPFTLVIKATMAFIAGAIIEKAGNTSKKTCLLAFTAASIFMVIAYFFAGILVATLIMGDAIGVRAGILFAARDIIPNIFQVTIAILITTPLINFVLKIRNSTYKS